MSDYDDNDDAQANLIDARLGQGFAFLRDVLGFPHVDVGGGWLIFGLPPSEVAVHPADAGGRHELYLMCDDVEAFVREMAARNVACGPGWPLSPGPGHAP